MRQITGRTCAPGSRLVFVCAHMATALTTLTLLEALAEPTRLRIINCLTAAPLFVSDLQSLLDIPQPTVSRHLRILRDVGLVRDTPIAQFVLYRLRRPADQLGRVLSAVLDAAVADPALRGERTAALDQSRRHARVRIETDMEGHPA
jgi:ArsR family transcriptional regulator, arsenate/arsenite/antimonite-responsive transcriptional repressor